MIYESTRQRIEGDSVACIHCVACAGKCPLNLDIPRFLDMYNHLIEGGDASVAAKEMETIPAENRPNKCIGCGACQFACPQSLEIWRTMGKLANMLK